MVQINDNRGKNNPKIQHANEQLEKPIPDPPDYSAINLEMQGERMLIQDWPKSEKIGSIFTPNNMEIAINKGRVVAIGPDVKKIKVGDVIYKASGLGQTLRTNSGDDYIFLPENAAIAIDKDFK